VGAAVQAGVLSGDAGSAGTNILLLDVTPLSLGIETLGGVMTKLIERNTTIPTRKSETFSTAEDGQTSVHVKVYQGEREIAAANKLLGDFQLSGIPPAPRGIPQIEVTFDIDANGIVSVSARDKATGREQKITISGTGSLNKDEIDRMVREAAAHAEEDKAQRERAETRNRAESLIYQTEKQIKDLGDKAPADLKTTVENAIANLRTALNSNDTKTDELTTLTDELQQSTFKLSEMMYQQATANGSQNGYGETGDAGHPQANPDEDTVIDMEFK
jgi:molecular chaperone DnaK